MTTLEPSKHGRTFVCYSYICFYSFIPRFQQIPTRTNLTTLFAFVFKKRGFILDEYLLSQTNIKIYKQISKIYIIGWHYVLIHLIPRELKTPVSRLSLIMYGIKMTCKGGGGYVTLSSKDTKGGRGFAKVSHYIFQLFEPYFALFSNVTWTLFLEKLKCHVTHGVFDFKHIVYGSFHFEKVLVIKMFCFL